MNTGILFPRSNTHPLIGSDFLEGLKSFSRYAGFDKQVNFLPETIGFGGAEKEVYAKTEKLLMMDDVDLLIGFIDEKILELIKPLILASGKLFILVNPGANYPLNWIPQPNIVTLGLQHSFLCALAGANAAGGRDKQVQAAMATTYFDCGYLHLSAMVNEFISSGGKIAFNYINNQTYNEHFHIGELTTFLNTNKEVDTLLCVFDSLPASLFYNHLNKWEDASRLKLFVSPMMLEKKAIEELDKGYGFSIEGYLPWHPANPSPSNQLFIDYYKQQLKKEPGIFSLLGWETSMLLKTILDDHGIGLGDGQAAVSILKTSSLNGPRGLLYFDDETNHFHAPSVHCSIAPNNSKMELEFGISTINEWEDFRNRSTEGVVSGWTNTYLCY